MNIRRIICSFLLIAVLLIPATATGGIDHHNQMAYLAPADGVNAVSSKYFAVDTPNVDNTPSIIQATNGSFFIVYESAPDVSSTYTLNLVWSPDGIQWGVPRIIISSTGSAGNRHPSLIQKLDGNLMLAYLTDRSGGYEIYTATSPDGNTWTEHGPLAVSGPAINPFLIQEDNGDFAISYQRYGTFLGWNDGAYFTRSTDGLTWDSGVAVCSNSEYHALPRLMRAGGGGDYMMTYQGGTSGTDFDIRYKTSADGVTWSAETRLTFTGNSHDSAPIQLVNGTYMVYFATVVGNNYELYRKWSPDMASWSADEFIDVANPTLYDTEPHPCQLASNQTFLLAWGHESAGPAGSYSDVDIGLVWIEDITIPDYNIPLNSGWNLVSLPLVQANTSIEAVLASISGQYSQVRIYDSWNAADHWKSYRPAFKLNDLGNLNRTMGIWINANASCILSVKGTGPTTTDIILKAGWNLVGYPTMNNHTADLALASTGADMMAVYNATAPYKLTDTTNLASVTMQPGEGYWVHVPVDTVWTIDW